MEARGFVKAGFVCGLASEAACLPGGAAIGLSGARPGRAESEAERLVAEGADALISFGLAGGLDPALKSGTLLVPEEILEEDGTRHAADHGLAGTFAGQAPEGRLLGVDRLIEGRRDKIVLRATHDADAVDMESHRVARVAARHGLPFLALRAIADPARAGLPLAARHAVREDGTVALSAVMAGLIRRPSDLPLLIALGGHSKKAHAALKRLSARLL